MTEKQRKALENIDMLYSEVAEIADGIVATYTTEIEDTITAVSEHIENLSVDDLRNYILKLSILSFSFGDIKEKSTIKTECAEAIKKELYARKFNETEGTVAVRENTALIESSESVVAELVYDCVSSLFKTKSDELHRMVDALKTVLMSKMQEAKMTMLTAGVGDQFGG